MQLHNPYLSSMAYNYLKNQGQNIGSFVLSAYLCLAHTQKDQRSMLPTIALVCLLHLENENPFPGQKLTKKRKMIQAQIELIKQ